MLCLKVREVQGTPACSDWALHLSVGACLNEGSGYNRGEKDSPLLTGGTAEKDELNVPSILLC